MHLALTYLGGKRFGAPFGSKRRRSEVFQLTPGLNLCAPGPQFGTGKLTQLGWPITDHKTLPHQRGNDHAAFVSRSNTSSALALKTSPVSCNVATERALS